MTYASITDFDPAPTRWPSINWMLTASAGLVGFIAGLTLHWV